MENKRGFRYLTIEEHKNGLEISLNEEGIELVKELKEDGKSEFDIWYELFEDVQGNSEYMFHNDMGESGFGMTSAEGITDGYFPSDNGYGYETNYPESAKVYWFPNYMVISSLDKMFEEGKVFFTKANESNIAEPIEEHIKFIKENPEFGDDNNDRVNFESYLIDNYSKEDLDKYKKEVGFTVINGTPIYKNGGGVNTGRSWHLDRQKRNKSESWEKPMSKRKQRYDDGGGIDKRDSWHSDRRQFNKNESWEKPMSQRKEIYANGGGVGENILIKDWYIENYPTDDLGQELNDDCTFKDVWTAIHNGSDVYTILGVGDSLVRERVFEKLSEINGVEYNYVYTQWLDNDKFGNGGNVGRDLIFKSKQPHEQNYNRKREWKEYKKEGWFSNWFKDGGYVFVSPHVIAMHDYIIKSYGFLLPNQGESGYDTFTYSDFAEELKSNYDIKNPRNKQVYDYLIHLGNVKMFSGNVSDMKKIEERMSTADVKFENGGGVDKRDSWHSDRRQFNKNESWEKPMSKRKKRYNNGGAITIKDVDEWDVINDWASWKEISPKYNVSYGKIVSDLADFPAYYHNDLDRNEYEQIWKERYNLQSGDNDSVLKLETELWDYVLNKAKEDNAFENYVKKLNEEKEKGLLDIPENYNFIRHDRNMGGGTGNYIFMHRNTKKELKLPDWRITEMGGVGGTDIGYVSREAALEKYFSKDKYSKGGGINSGRDLLFKSQEPHEQAYNRKTEWKEYKKEGWFSNWFENGGGIKHSVTAHLGEVISINTAEMALGRKINSWKDEVITIDGISYRKVYLKPEYKQI